MGESGSTGLRSGDAAAGGSPRRDSRFPVTPTLEPDTTQGQVVITRFHCGDLVRVLVVLLLHLRVKRDVRRHAEGFLSWAARAVAGADGVEHLALAGSRQRLLDGRGVQARRRVEGAREARRHHQLRHLLPRR